VFRETHQSSRSRHKIGQGKVYYRDTECITKLYLGSRRLLKEDASRRSTSIEYEFEGPVLEVLMDRSQIQQIIINLVNKNDSDRLLGRRHQLACGCGRSMLYNLAPVYAWTN
jgi:hypothetical protein